MTNPVVRIDVEKLRALQRAAKPFHGETRNTSVPTEAEQAFRDELWRQGPSLLDEIAEQEARIAALETAWNKVEKDANELTEYPAFAPGEDFDSGWNAARDRWLRSLEGAKS